MQALFLGGGFVPRSLPLLRLIEEMVESTVAAAGGWPGFSRSRPLRQAEIAGWCRLVWAARTSPH